MLLVYFIFFLNYAIVCVIGSFSPIYYRFSPPAPAPFPALVHHSAFFAPTYQPQPFAYSSTISSPNIQISHNGNEAFIKMQSSFGTNPYNGFIYRTNLGNEASTNVFFLTGTNAHEQEQIQRFITTVSNNMDNQIIPKANVEKIAPEKIRPVSDLIQKMFEDQPGNFQYIYNSEFLPSLPKGRSLSENIPVRQLIGNEKIKAVEDAKPTEKSKQVTTEKESPTEKMETTTTISSSTTVESPKN